jgi:hypothetical protein
MYCFPLLDHYTPFSFSPNGRSSGTHLTQIIRSIQDDLGMSKKAAGWEMNTCANIGFLWEDAFSTAYADYHSKLIMRPGELVSDEGIIMSPDGLGPDPFEQVPIANHEYKCTWRSSNKEPTGDFYWDTQFKCYCKGLMTTVTVLHVMYVNGDYKGSGPLEKHFRLEYSEQEIDTAWGMVVKHARDKGWIN